MRVVTILVALAAGFGAGWLAHDLFTEDRPAPRSGRREARRDAQPEPERVQPPAPPAPGTGTGTPPAPPAPSASAEKPATPVSPAGEDEDYSAMLRTQMPAMKVMAEGQAKAQAEGLARELGFDQQTTDLFAAALGKVAGEQMENAFRFLFGEEGAQNPDINAFMLMMGAADELPVELESELGTFLSDGEIQAVRERMHGRYERQMDQQAEMQIAMMGISDLTEAQRTQVKDVLRGKDQMQENFRRFSSAMRDRKRRAEMFTQEGMEREILAGLEPQRERMRQILTPEQFRGYEKYEKTLVQQAKMGLRMFTGFKPKPKSPAPPQPAGPAPSNG